MSAPKLREQEQQRRRAAADAERAAKAAEATKAAEAAKAIEDAKKKERNVAQSKINTFCAGDFTPKTVFKEFKALLEELPKITEELSRFFGWTHTDDMLLKKYIENNSKDVNWILCLTPEQLEEIHRFWNDYTDKIKKELKEKKSSITITDPFNIKTNRDDIKHALQFMEDKTKENSFKGNRAKKIWETLEQLMGLIENQRKSKELDMMSISGIQEHIENTKKEARHHEEERMKNAQAIKPNQLKNKYLKYKMKYLKLKKELNL